MERLRNRHYYLFFAVAFLCITASMTLLSILTIFAGAFPDRLHTFFKGPGWIVLFFWFAPFPLIFGIAHFSTRFIDFTFNLFFQRRNVIANSTDIRLLNRSWKLSLRSSFMTFESALAVVVVCASKSFYWLRRGNIDFSSWLMVGTIIIYVFALLSAYQLFISAVSSYISTKDLMQSLGSDIQVDPTGLESADNGTINADKDGFDLNDQYGDDFLDWRRVQEVHAYKREDVVDFVLGLDFLTEEGEWWKIRDNMVGYHDMQSWLPQGLPGFDENWSKKALDPRFQAQRYILWRRGC